MAILNKNQVVGLDIGSCAIKLVEIEHTKNGRNLKNFGMVGVPHGAIVEGSIKDIEAVSNVIRNLFDNLRVNNRNVAVSLSGYAVIAKKIELDKTDETEMEALIHQEAEKHIPFDINDVNIDFAVLPRVKSDSDEDEDDKKAPATSQMMDVMLVAAKKDVVEEYINLINAANLNPVILDVDVFALQNAVEVSVENPLGSFAIINIGANELQINTIRNGISIFSRDSSYGGARINGDIMAAFDVTFEEAEKIKLGGSEEKGRRDSLESIFTSQVSTWVKEIRRALEFVAGTYAGGPVAEILLAGGSCRLPGFARYLEMETGITVKELNPFFDISINEKHFDLDYLNYIAPQAGVAVGLALRSIGDK
ncbi:MAG TPA: type IV pilus assembly protein PilM [Deltaproteobacteria bacterium]|nr:type IV pilus assembly protein PilM [Deltaproteobacteria bacterium]HIJ41264.1 type IV pilus assembly protein PilM [Deltaproteobacteria bacterium]